MDDVTLTETLENLAVDIHELTAGLEELPEQIERSTDSIRLIVDGLGEISGMLELQEVR